MKRIELQNFRMFERSAFEFDQARTLVLGANGRGKSTIVDAIAWCLTGRCRGVDGRGQGQKELIRAGADSMAVELQVAGLGTVTRTLAKDGHAVSNVKTEAILAHLGVSEAMLMAAIYAGTFFRMGHAEAKGLLMGLLDVRVPADQLPGLGFTEPATLDELEAQHALAVAARAAAKKALAAVVVPQLPAALSNVEGEDIGARVHEATATYQAQARAAAAAEQQVTTAQRAIDAIDARINEGPSLAAKLKVNEEMHADEAGKLAAARADLDKIQAEDAEDADTLRSQADDVKTLAERLARHEPSHGCVLSAGIPCLTEGKHFAAHVAKLKKDAKTLATKIKAAVGRADTMARLQQVVLQHERTVAYHANQITELKKAQAVLTDDAAARPGLVQQLDTAKTAYDRATAGLDEARAAMDRLQAVQTAQAAMDQQRQAQEALAKQEALVALLGPSGVRADALAGKLEDFEAMINAALEPFGFLLQIVVDPWRVDIVRTDGSRLPFVLLSAGEQLWCSLAFQVALAVVSGLRFAVLDAAEAVVGKHRQLITGMVMGAPAMDQVIVAMARADNEPAPQLPGLQVIRL